jgi:hypothetical protein
MVQAPEEPEPPEPPKPPGQPPSALEPKKAKNRTLEWFSRNPIFGLIGFVVGVVSLLATVYFGVTALKSRDLSLTVNPTKTTIVRAGQSSDLHVLYKGQSVSTDVTALQVGIWNAGKESIRPEHVLSPIVLQTSPKVPILEVRVRHTSRSVCDIALDQSQLADGKVGLTWKILEHNDGVVIQLIVAGPTNVTVTVRGSMEGDSAVRFVITKRQYISWWEVGGLGIFLVCFGWFSLWGVKSQIRSNSLYQKYREQYGRDLSRHGNYLAGAYYVSETPPIDDLRTKFFTVASVGFIPLTWLGFLGLVVYLITLKVTAIPLPFD